MYLPIPSQPDCVSAWREAVRHVDMQSGHHAYNVIIDVTDPLRGQVWPTLLSRLMTSFY